MTSEGPEPESNRLPAAMFHGFFATECRCGPPLQVLFSLEINCHMLSKIYRQFKKKWQERDIKDPSPDQTGFLLQ
jgi:hypothetical protein